MEPGALPLDGVSVTVAATAASAAAVRVGAAAAAAGGCSTKPPPQAPNMQSMNNDADSFVVLRFELILSIRIFDEITAFRFFGKQGPADALVAIELTNWRLKVAQLATHNRCELSSARKSWT
jgi:hypothetical protein